MSKNLPATLAQLNGNEVRNTLMRWKPIVSKIAPNELDPTRILQIAAIVVNNNPDLKNCSTNTLIGCILESSILGLDLTPALGLASILPFKNKATFVIGYKGLVNLMYRSGKVKSVHSEVVCENDEFEFELGDNPHIHHKYNLKNERGDMIGAYAVVTMDNGEKISKVLPKDIIMRHRACSPAKSSKHSPWNGNFEYTMWMKTVLREIIRTAPLSVEETIAIATDNSIVSTDNFLPGGKLELANVQSVIAEEQNVDIEKNGIKYRLSQKANEIKNGYSQKEKPFTEPKIDPKQDFAENWSNASDKEIIENFNKLSKKVDLSKFHDKVNFAYMQDQKTKKFKHNFEFMNKKDKLNLLWLLFHETTKTPNPKSNDYNEPETTKSEVVETEDNSYSDLAEDDLAGVL